MSFTVQDQQVSLSLGGSTSGNEEFLIFHTPIH